MARLPGENFLIQQIGGNVVLFEDYTEREIVRFDPTDANAAARAQFTIYSCDDLTAEQKSFAHFWSGYFYAHAGGRPEDWRSEPIPLNDVPVLPGEGGNSRHQFKVDTTHFHEYDQDGAHDKTFENEARLH